MKVLLLALLCFAAGYLWAVALRPALAVAECPPPASLPVAAASLPAVAPRSARKTVAVQQPSPPALVRDSDLAALATCFDKPAYRGSRIVLQIETLPGGRVRQVTPIGAEFLDSEERKCAVREVKRWQMGLESAPMVTLSVTL